MYSFDYSEKKKIKTLYLFMGCAQLEILRWYKSLKCNFVLPSYWDSRSNNSL